MLKKLRVTVDGKAYDVTVELQTEGETSEAAIAVPATSLAPAPATPPPVAAPTPPAVPPALVSPAEPAAPKPSSRPAAGAGAVLSPLAGRVTAVVAQVGQQVKEGDHLLTLEAMKMNTFVFASKAGRVAEITTNVGAAVEEGQCLARIE